MDMLIVLYKSIFAPLKVMNRDKVKNRLQASVFVVIATVFLSSVVAPLIYFYANTNKYENSLQIGSMFIGLTVSIITWFVVCSLFWLLSRVFNKKIPFSQVISTWGLSYIPNFFCIILYNLLFIVPQINNGSGFSAFLISSLFIMFLVWKALYYFMFMRFVINTTLIEICVFTAISAVVFVTLMLIGFGVGIQVPML